MQPPAFYFKGYMYRVQLSSLESYLKVKNPEKRSALRDLCLGKLNQIQKKGTLQNLPMLFHSLLMNGTFRF